MTPSSLDSAEIVHGQSLPDQSSERGGEIYFWSGIQGKGEAGEGGDGERRSEIDAILPANPYILMMSG